MTVTILVLGNASGSMFPVIIARLKEGLTVTIAKKAASKTKHTTGGWWVEQPFSGQVLTIQMLAIEMSFRKPSLLMFVVAFRSLDISILILNGLRTFSRPIARALSSILPQRAGSVDKESVVGHCSVAVSD